MKKDLKRVGPTLGVLGILVVEGEEVGLTGLGGKGGRDRKPVSSKWSTDGGQVGGRVR